MSKKRKWNDLPKPPKPYPGSERFGDWDFSSEGSVIWMEPGDTS